MLTGGLGLGNQTILAKIDKLRELNIGALIPLPQLVVVGDQSSGKSSVLESLTGFAFPRAAGLCTRYATQITCSRDPVKGILVSITPRPDSNDALKAQLLRFKRHLSDLDDGGLANIFREANVAMGIHMSVADDTGRGAFSQDILKIEISGPEQEHLTVIGVPGIFRVLTPGLTTEADIELIENMVKSYMENPRTIILAVMPCNVDIATQEILKLAEAADPKGVRTKSVLTKPDLVSEAATQGAVIDLVLGKRSILKLGYYVVKNRSADDNASTLDERAAAERSFFASPSWSLVAGRCGAEGLKLKVCELLVHLNRGELPNVKEDVELRLRFLVITQAALNGYYKGDIFKRLPGLKLITKIMKLNEDFSTTFWERGHKRDFGLAWDDDEESPFRHHTEPARFEDALAEYPELDDFVEAGLYQCPTPLEDPVIEHIEQVYESSRGPELGTYGGTLLAIAFEEQSEKWEHLVISHASRAIAIVHDYIFQLLTELCPEWLARDRIWDALLVDKLADAYRRAMTHARFLLSIERTGTLSTFNYYFYAKLREYRSERITETSKKLRAVEKDERTQVCEDILDTLMGYYKVSRKRFVDVVCQQVVLHFLLEGEESPLKLFSPDLVMSLDNEQLEQIAGEDAQSRHQRQVWTREVESLTAALKVLRS
ncbi:interferon-induced GTP-binding protein Mx2 [Colletotrichum cereale]|nr:interferon-induced GTP-binding protein Mx2 [Colletotrichum cereale]